MNTYIPRNVCLSVWRILHFGLTIIRWSSKDSLLKQINNLRHLPNRANFFVDYWIVLHYFWLGILEFFLFFSFVHYRNRSREFFCIHCLFHPRICINRSEFRELAIYDIFWISFLFQIFLILQMVFAAYYLIKDSRCQSVKNWWTVQILQILYAFK